MNYLSVAAEECAALGRDQQVVESFPGRDTNLGSLKIPDHINHSIRTPPSHELSKLERKARLSQSQKSVAYITGISGQLEEGSIKLFLNTNRRQIQPQESAWRDQVDSSE